MSDTSTPTPPRSKTPRSKWLYLFLVPPLLLLFLILAALLFLRTDFGLQRLEILLNSSLADVGGQQIAVSGLHGRFPFDLRLHELRLADAEGPWLEVDEIVLRWSGRDLLAARVRILELSANRVELFRIPASDESKPPPEPARPDSWDALLDFEPPSAFPRAALDNLDIRRIILAEAVAGERIVLRLRGDLDAGEHGIRTNLRLDSLGGPAGEAGLLSLRAGFAPETDHLDLRLAFTDPDGALAPLLGLPPATPLEVTLDGDAPAMDWEGVFSSQAGELLSLHSELGLAWSQYPNLSWHGRLAVAPALLPEPAQDLLPPTTFQLKASMPRPDAFHLGGISLRNDLLWLDAHADVELGLSSLQGEVELNVLDTAPLAELTGVELGPQIVLRTDLSGPLTGPDIQIALNLTDLAAGPLRTAQLELDAGIQFNEAAKTSPSRPNISVTGSMIAQGLHVPDTALPKELTVNFEGTYRQADNVVDLESLTLTGQGLDLRAVAGYSLGTSRLDALLELQPMPIQPWLAPHGLDGAKGEADLRITAQGTVQPMQLAVDLDTGLNQLAGLPDPLPQLLGTTPRLQAQVRLLPPKDPSVSGPGTIQAQSVRLQAPGLDLQAAGDFTPATGGVNGQATLTLPDLRLAAPAPDLGLAGAAVLDVQAGGDLNENLALRLSLRSDNLRVADLAAFPLQLLVDVRSLPKAPHGELSFSASPLQAPLLLETDFALDETLLHLTELELRVPEGALQGQGMLDLDSRLVTAGLQGRIPDIAPLAALAGQTMHGALELDLTLLPDGQAQNALFQTSLQGLHADFGTLDSLTLDAEVQDAMGMLDGPHIQLDIAARELHAGETQIQHLTASLDGSLAQMGLRATAQGYALHPFTLHIEAATADIRAGRTLHLTSLTGDWAGQELRLTDPVLLTLADREQTLSPLHLELGKAIIRADARIGEQDADLRLGVENLPLALFTQDLQGNLTAGAVLHGPKSGLRGDVTVLGHNLTPALIDLENLPAMDLQADLVLDGETITLAAHLGETRDTRPLLQAQGRTMMTLGLEPPGLVVPPDAPVDANVRGELDLGWLGEIILPDSQLLVGVLDVDLQLEGTLDTPRPKGDIQIRQAGYQHLLQGVLLQEIKADARISDHHLQLLSLTATDGGQGRLQAHGEASLDPEENLPFQFSIQLDAMDILDSPMVRARLSRVDLDMSGSTAAQEVRGLVIVDRVEVMLRDIGGPQVVDLPVVEKHGSDVTPQREEPQEALSAPDIPLSLDMEIRFPTQVFARGRGLDSEWGGNLHVTGTASKPEIRGDIRPLRGRLDLLGKRFTVEPESLIQFTGGQPPLPFVNLVATQTRRDPDGEKTFTVRISGVPPDLNQPQLSSTPPLPQDEILAQMLFGRSLSGITPTQAAQLALAARELAGHGSGVNLMGTARDLLQLDDLDLVSGQGEGMSLRAGKHVHDRVYLRLDSDLKTGEETATVDVTVSPRINLESVLGPRGSGMGLFWRRDY